MAYQIQWDIHTARTPDIGYSKFDPPPIQTSLTLWLDLDFCHRTLLLLIPSLAPIRDSWELHPGLTRLPYFFGIRMPSFTDGSSAPFSGSTT
jgi:hypothetical protein